MALGLPARITLGDKTIAGFLNRILAEINEAVRELGGLDDVTFTALGVGEVMEYDGAVWINTGRAATTTKTGFVKQATASPNASGATATTISIVSGAVSGTADLAYNDVERDMINNTATLINEMRFDMIQLISDFNDVVTEINAIKDNVNDLKAKLRTAGSLAT